MATTNELVQSWVSSGGKVNSDGKPVDSTSESTGVKIVGDDDYVMSGESSSDEILPGSEGEGEDTQEGSPTESEQASSEDTTKASGKGTPNKEVITITDEKGKRKIEVDFGDKESLRKYVQMAHGARKWQAERDQALARSKQLETNHSEMKQNWDSLERIYQNGGVESLIDMLEGRKGAYKEHLQRQLDKHEFLKKASPEEIEALEARELSHKQARELDRMRKENEEFKQQVEAERQESEVKALQADVNPVFSKYRFADKLGSPDDEHMFDEMLWNSSLKRLQTYEEQGLDITQELIDREFRTVSTALRKRINSQTEKRVANAIEQKKQEATENAQAKVKSGYKSSGVAKEAGDLIRNGNLTGLLKNWGKYGGVFRK